ncbi:hypothetical protein Z949_1912 [Sulfitobacter guttiformis KCTC 32187]|nr:hypothetical protein Z949_1912 [Sulfitobacter guttiformis KCTC 32187]
MRSKYVAQTVTQTSQGLQLSICSEVQLYVTSDKSEKALALAADRPDGD